jgi:hypothetical protein
MATFEESFLYPLILLLVGAGVSGVLVAWLTNRWQDRRTERENKLEDCRKKREIEVENNRKRLEIKVDIASKIAEALAYQIATENIHIDREKKYPLMLKKMLFMKIKENGLLTLI